MNSVIEVTVLNILKIYSRINYYFYSNSFERRTLGILNWLALPSVSFNCFFPGLLLLLFYKMRNNSVAIQPAMSTVYMKRKKKKQIYAPQVQYRGTERKNEEEFCDTGK